MARLQPIARSNCESLTSAGIPGDAARPDACAMNTGFRHCSTKVVSASYRSGADSKRANASSITLRHGSAGAGAGASRGVSAALAGRERVIGERPDDLAGELLGLAGEVGGQVFGALAQRRDANLDADEPVPQVLPKAPLADARSS